MSSYPKTYRVRGVPIYWDENCLRTFIVSCEAGCGPSIESLEPEVNVQTLTGTVTFKSPPAALLEGDKKWELKVPKEEAESSTRRRWIEVEGDFIGLTTLFAPNPENHKVE